MPDYQKLESGSFSGNPCNLAHSRGVSFLGFALSSGNKYFAAILVVSCTDCTGIDRIYVKQRITKPFPFFLCSSFLRWCPAHSLSEIVYLPETFFSSISPSLVGNPDFSGNSEHGIMIQKSYNIDTFTILWHSIIFCVQDFIIKLVAHFFRISLMVANVFPLS